MQHLSPDGLVRDSKKEKKMTRPGGTAGRVGCGTGVDEAPVPDAGSTIRAFSSENLPRTRSGVGTGWHEENAPNRNPLSRSSVIAGANPADVVAEGVELADPAKNDDCE